MITFNLTVAEVITLMLVWSIIRPITDGIAKELYKDIVNARKKRKDRTES